MELLNYLCMYGVFYGILLLIILSYSGKKKDNQELLGREAAGELKGIAILMVLVGHLAYMFGYLVIPVTPALGAPAVDLFLFLSAFGLMSSYREKGIKGFWKRRLAIILIPYLVATVIKLLAYPLIGQVTFKIVLMNLLPIAFGPTTSIDMSMWYVQYILIWYLLFYTVFSVPRLSVKSKTSFLLAAGIVAAAAFGILYYQGTIFNINITLMESYSHHLSFPLGAIFFLFYDKFKELSVNVYFAVAGCSFVIFQFLAYPGPDGYIKYYVNNIGYIVFLVAVVALLKHFGRSSGFLRWIGRWSYYIYLNELIIMSLFYNLSPLPEGVNAVLIILVSVVVGAVEGYVCEWILQKLKIRGSASQKTEGFPA